MSVAQYGLTLIAVDCTMRTTRAYVVTASGNIILEKIVALSNHAVTGQHYRIRVRAVAISYQEIRWIKQGRVLTFGHGYSGTVNAALAGSEYPVGTDVVAMAPIGSDGAAADYVNASEYDVAAKPPAMTHEHAATVPLAALIAWRAIEVGNFRGNQRLLICGPETAVGQMAQRLARLSQIAGWALYPTYAKGILSGLNG